MIGAISGDIIGSIYERNNIKTKNFNFYIGNERFTDDSVMTCAVSNACLKYLNNKDKEEFKVNLIYEMQLLGLSHLNAGYGGMFIKWLFKPIPYNSFGNGSAMRVSPIGYISESLEETLALAEISASISHNHPEGIKGAQAVSAAIFLIRQNWKKEDVKNYIEKNFYKLNFSINEIRDNYKFDVSCQGSVPEALEAFFESNSFEDAIRNAISIGGDSDTIAAITGSLAEAYYGVPEYIKEKSITYLDASLENSVKNFYNIINKHNKINR